MAQDVTEFVKNLNSKQLFLGITFEQLILLLQGSFLVLAVTLWTRDLRRRKYSPQVPAGCTKLGLVGPSHATDEFDSRYDKGTEDVSKWRVKALYIHPIKSCAAVELDVADVDVEGMTYDRKFAFAEHIPALKADENGEKPLTWKFRTLREPGYNKLALVRPEVWVPKQSDGAPTGSLRRVEQEGRLIVRYPFVPVGRLAWLERLALRWGLIQKHSAFSVPLIPPRNHKYPVETVNIWKDNPDWINMGEHVPNDFREWLGAKHPVSLFRADPDNYRNLFRCAPSKEEAGFQPVVAFPDSYPLHILNIASVHEVGERVRSAIKDLSIRRFRPNILMEGPPRYEEDQWKRIAISGHELYSSCHTTRCKLPCVDPDTSERHPAEPQGTLLKYRRIDKGNEKSPCLGMQLVPTTTQRFRISVGDKIEVLERGEHYFIK